MSSKWVGFLDKLPMFSSHLILWEFATFTTTWNPLGFHPTSRHCTDGSQLGAVLAQALTNRWMFQTNDSCIHWIPHLVIFHYTYYTACLVGILISLQSYCILIRAELHAPRCVDGHGIFTNITYFGRTQCTYLQYDFYELQCGCASLQKGCPKTIFCWDHVNKNMIMKRVLCFEQETSTCWNHETTDELSVLRCSKVHSHCNLEFENTRFQSMWHLWKKPLFH